MGRFQVETIFRAKDFMSGTIAKMQARTALMTKSISKDFDTLSKNVSAFGSGLKTVATAGVAATAVLGAGMFGLAQTGADFEHTLASLAAVAKPTAAELAGLSKTALQVGADFGFSAIDVAKSMEAMNKQGHSVQQILSGIGGIAAAAAADGSTLDETMGGLLSTMTTMGLGSGQLQHVADVMAKAGDSTAASIGSLSASMAIFGIKAKDLGIPLESAIGQLAILQDAGIDASSAGTTLTAVYSKLTAPFGRTGDAIKKLGIEVADAFGNMKPPEQLMNEILRATGKIQGNVGKAAAITELVGLESQKALSNIVGSIESGKFDKVMSSLTQGVDGYASSIAAAKQDSTVGDINKLTAAFQGLQIQLFGLVSADIRGKIVQPITEWIGANQALIASKFVEFMTHAKEAAALVAENFSSIVTWAERIGIAVGAFFALRAAVAVTETAIAAYGLVVGGVGWVTKALGFETLGAAAATGASRAATILATAAQGVYSGAVAFGAFMTRGFTLAEIRSKAALIASNVITWLSVTARGAFATVSGLAATGATALGVAAAGSAPGIAASTAALGPFLIAIGAVTAAVGALYLAWTQWQGLDKTMGGEAGSSFMRMLDNGDFSLAGFAKANDDILNEKAQTQAAMREQGPAPIAPMVTPQDRVAHSVSETSSTTKTEVVLKPAPGVQLEQTKGPKRTPGLNLQPTGGF